MRTLRIGIVGLGVIPRFCTTALEQVPGVRLAAACGADVLRDAAGLDRRALLTLNAVRDPAATVRIELDWSYDEEHKDLNVVLADGRCYRADILAGRNGFKASLWHEYLRVVRGFAAVAAGGASGDVSGGLEALEGVADVCTAEVLARTRAGSEAG